MHLPDKRDGRRTKRRGDGGLCLPCMARKTAAHDQWGAWQSKTAATVLLLLMKSERQRQDPEIRSTRLLHGVGINQSGSASKDAAGTRGSQLYSLKNKILPACALPVSCLMKLLSSSSGV